MRQHYVPQFYLKQFSLMNTKEPRVLVHDLMTSRRFYSPIKAVASRNDFYDQQRGAPGSPEAILGAMETDAGPVIAQLVDAERVPVDGGSRLRLSLFIAALAVRGADRRERMGSVSKEVRQELERRGFAVEGGLAHQLRDPTDEELVESHVRHIAEVALRTYREIAARSWRLITPPLGRIFVTSDAPVAVTSRSVVDGARLGAGLLGQDAEIFLPLTPILALLINDRPSSQRNDSLHHASERCWFRMNQTTIAHAHRQLYARRDEDLFVPDGLWHPPAERRRFQ